MTFPRDDHFSLQAPEYLSSWCSLPHVHIWGVGGLTVGSEISLERPQTNSYVGRVHCP
jgi:hypothetical protein